MKMRFFALGTVLMTLVGCVSTSGGSNYTIIYMLTRMETTYAASSNKPNKVSTYTYRQITGTAPDPNNPNRFSSYPEVVRQEISGDTLKRIDYSYNVEKRTITARRHHVDGRQFVDSLGLNERGMAATRLREGQAPVPYTIRYADNAGALRTAVDKVELTSAPDPYNYGGAIYRSATVGGSVVGEYYYEARPNFIKLQQHTIPGSPYYWATDRFGGQSAYLLKYSEVLENGVKVRYDFTYTLNASGFVAQEFIKRDGTLLLTNTYQYTQGVVLW